jgi:hypothetical protein
MSEKLLKILVGELKLVRLVCTKSDCGAVAEVTIEQLTGGKEPACPICHTSYQTTMPGGGLDALTMMAVGLQTLAKASERFTVEFVLPDKP